MNNDNEIYPQITPRKKVSLAKPPAERSQLVSGTFGSVAGGRSGRRISLEKKPGDGIYINPNPVREINFPSSPMPAVNAAQIPAARNNIARLKFQPSLQCLGSWNKLRGELNRLPGSKR